MKTIVRFAWLWMALIMWGLVGSCVNLVYVFSFPVRMWLFSCLAWGTMAILLAFSYQRARK